MALSNQKSSLNHGGFIILSCLITGSAIAADTHLEQHANNNASKASQLAVEESVSGGFVKGQILKNPPILKSENGKLEMRLKTSREVVNISGKKVGARVYSITSGNKSFPASFMPPVIEVSPGDNLQVVLDNRLGETTNLHTHGFFISPIGNQDNIFVALDNGKSFSYNYFIPKDISPGSYWFHPHYHPLVEEQVFGGMSGLILVKGLVDLLPPELQGLEEKFLGLKDFQLTSKNTIPNEDINSDAPTNRTINGQIEPVIKMHPGETQVWHIGNIGADIFYKLTAMGLSVTIVAEDGNPYNRPKQTLELTMPPGKRYDVLVQAPNAGVFQLMTQSMTTGVAGDTYPTALMATIQVEGTPQALIQIPNYTIPIENLRTAKVDRRREFDLSENTTLNKFFINERVFNENHVDATPLTGTVEEWVFRNYAQEMHPIHTHVNDMQVLSINGVEQPFYSQVDTHGIPSAVPDANGKLIPGEVVIRTRFREFIGPYVFHCHILSHEDNGMMTVINVSTPGSEGHAP